MSSKLHWAGVVSAVVLLAMVVAAYAPAATPVPTEVPPPPGATATPVPPTPTPVPPTACEAAGGKEGGTFTEVSFADAENLNPILSVDTSSAENSALIFDALTEIHGDTLEVIPQLAHSWEISDDGLTYTYYLRDDVTWHDGEPFTCQDVEFTYEMILDEDLNSPRRANLADILTPEQITCLDDYTLEFQLSSVLVSFECCEMYQIIPYHLLGEMTAEDLNVAEFNTNPIGTGPFIFQEWVKDDHLLHVANENYWGGRPCIDQYVYKIVEDFTAMFAQLQTGEVDYGGVESAMWDACVADETLNCHEVSAFGFTFYIYQLDPEITPLFQDVRVRQALLYALDREAMVEAALFGHGSVADTVVPPISWAFNPDNEPVYPYDVEKAEALLDEAEVIDRDGDGVRELPDGTPMSFTLRTNAGNTERETCIAAMQEFWREIGVEAKIETEEWGAFLSRLTETFDFEMILVGFSWDIDPDQKAMWHTDSYPDSFNMNMYSNPELDEILDAALETPDREERKELYFEMQRILAEEVPNIIVYFDKDLYATNKRVQNMIPTDIRDDNRFDVNIWYLE